MECSTTVLLNDMKLTVFFLFFFVLSPQVLIITLKHVLFNRKKRREPETEENGLKVEPAILSVEVLFRCASANHACMSPVSLSAFVCS